MTVSTTEFEWQLKFLRKHYEPITFDQFSRWFLKGYPLPQNPVLVTFDDGHANNFELALPILQQLQVPAVCFVVTGSIGQKSLTWFEDAYFRLMFSPATQWELRNGEVWPLNTAAERSAACGRFFCLCRGWTETEQSQELKFLRAQLKVAEVNGHFPGRFEFLSADQLRGLRQHGVEIGAHTVTHPILAALTSQGALSEISSSKQQLEDCAATSVRAFAYPFGAPSLDFTDRERSLVRDSGFELAFAGEGGFVERTHDRFSLPRMGIGNMSRAQFATTVTGTLDTMRQFVRERVTGHFSAL
jgi:peptidoglycan/xylan/chitin deacetylase (PgdA/CDA1 family)